MKRRHFFFISLFLAPPLSPPLSLFHPAVAQQHRKKNGAGWRKIGIDVHAAAYI